MSQRTFELIKLSCKISALMFEFHNKLFLITGGAQGLGRGFTEAILARGSKVAIADLNEDVGRKSLQELCDRFGNDKVHFIKCDVTKSEDFERAWNEAEKHFSASIDVLVNNAGINHLRGWKKCLDVNLYGTMNGARLAMERMKGGLVVNMGSMASFLPADIEASTSYHVSKHGVLGLTKSLGTKAIFNEKKIRVAALCPFFASTDIIKADAATYALVKEKLGERHIMSVDRVAEAFIGLLEDEGRNGAALCVFPHVPPFYWPIFAWGPLYYFLLVAIFAKFANLRIVGLKTQIFVGFVLIALVYWLLWT